MVFHQWIITMILLFLVLLGKSFSQARQLKGAAMVVTHVDEFAVDGNSGVNLNKEVHDPTSERGKFESNGVKKPSTTKTGNITRETSKLQTRNGGKVGRGSSAAAHSGRKRKGKNGNSNFMVFNEDYHSPKQHPPRNN